MSRSDLNEYPDTNGNGVPDAFENRRPLSELLNLDESEIKSEQYIRDTLVVELETGLRPPNMGELYIGPGGITRETYAMNFPQVIVRRILAAPPDWKPL